MQLVLSIFLAASGLYATDQELCTFPARPVLPHEYVIKWEFVRMCQHAHDPLTLKTTYPIDPNGITCDPHAVKAGDCIFLRGRVAHEFFTEVAPHITVPYCIISHGERYDAFKNEYRKYLDDPHVLAWFTTHAPSKEAHNKLHAIPLGTSLVSNKSYDYFKQVYLGLRTTPKDKLMFIRMSRKTNPLRDALLNHFESIPEFSIYDGRLNFESFMKRMAQHKFTLSPPGYQVDCYRTWEAILVGSIPVIEHSHLDYLYEGLPVLFISDWYSVTPQFLKQEYARIVGGTYNYQALSMSYWKDRILCIRDAALKKYTTPHGSMHHPRSRLDEHRK